ncbi:MAG: RNA polymerase sigma factor [Vicinamibacteria bacterium]
MDVPGPEPDDEELAARAAAGDDRAFEALVGRYQARAYGLAYRLVGPEGDPQDALQEAFLQVFRKLSGFRGESRFSTWLYRIVTNAALMQRRSRSRRPTESLEACLPRFDADGRHVATPVEIAAASGVEERLDRRALAEKAMAGIDRLPEAYRSAFVLRDLEELPTAEVGAVLGLEAAAVRQRVHRARLMLRGYLGDIAGVKP